MELQTKVDKGDIFGASGGGSRYVAHINGSHELFFYKGYAPGILTGISAGGLSNWCSMTRDEDIVLQGIHEGENLTMSKIFHKKNNEVLSEKGKLTRPAGWKLVKGTWKLIRGKDDEVSLGRQQGLELMIKALIPESAFKDYKRNVKNGYAPESYIGLVDFMNGRPEVFPIHELDYETACKVTLATASIAFVSPAVWINGRPYQDGGHYYHNMLHLMMDSHPDRKTFKKAVSFFARVDDVFLEEKPDWGTLWGKASRTFSIFQNCSAEKDEIIEELRGRLLGIQDNHHQVFFDTGMKGLFDLRPWMLKKAGEVGRTEVRKLKLD